MQSDVFVMSDMSPSQPLPVPKTKRGERTRQKILDAAEREIGRKGFAEASISTITAEAAVGQGTFYLYFRSKEDALRELAAILLLITREEFTYNHVRRAMHDMFQGAYKAYLKAYSRKRDEGASFEDTVTGLVPRWQFRMMPNC